MSYGEASRKYRRTQYTHEDWVKHRSDDRILKNFATILDSGIARQLVKEVGITAGVAGIAWLYNMFFVFGYEDLSNVHHDPLTHWVPLVLPGAPFSFASPALALLLVFKTNTSYARWDEARKAWGAIVNNTRSIVRMSTAWTTSKDTEQIQRLCDYTWAFPRSMTRHLLGDEDAEEYAKDVRAKLPADIADELVEVRHKPLKAMSNLSNELYKLPLTDFQRNLIENSISELCNASGGCERIFGSPVPLVYTRHTARFVSVWLFLLPLALWEPFKGTWNHFGMMPASILISFFMFGLEELAIALEEPFSVLPLHKLTAGIGLATDEHAQWFEQNMDKKSSVEELELPEIKMMELAAKMGVSSDLVPMEVITPGSEEVVEPEPQPEPVAVSAELESEPELVESNEEEVKKTSKLAKMKKVLRIGS